MREIGRQERLMLALQEAAETFMRHEYGREQRQAPTDQATGGTSSFAYQPEQTGDEAARDEQYVYVVAVQEIRIR